MAVKTFTTGEVLTAADTNTYLANAGLDYIKQVTVGSAVASVDVTSCFSATYDNYRIVYSNITPSAGQDLTVTLLSGTTPSTTGYYRGFIYVNLATSAVTGSALQNAGSFPVASVSSTSFRHAGIIELFMPFLTQYTGMWSTNYLMRTDITAPAVSGSHQVATSYDGLRITTSTGTITGGTITVYGYRKG